MQCALSHFFVRVTRSEDEACRSRRTWTVRMLRWQNCRIRSLPTWSALSPSPWMRYDSPSYLAPRRTHVPVFRPDFFRFFLVWSSRKWWSISSTTIRNGCKKSTIPPENQASQWRTALEKDCIPIPFNNEPCAKIKLLTCIHKMDPLTSIGRGIVLNSGKAHFVKPYNVWSARIGASLAHFLTVGC